MDIKEISLKQLCVELTKPAWNVPLIFVGDVGGTSARLGFARRGRHDGAVIMFSRFHMANKDINDLIDFFKTIIAAAPPAAIARVAASVLNVPGPVTDGVVGGPFNNLKGLARLADYPALLFPSGRSVILNDLEAGGFGVLAVSDAHVFNEYFELLWKGTRGGLTSGIAHSRCLVLAPGTGLGSSLIHYDPVGGRHIVLPLELGSQTLPLREDKAYIEAATAALARQPNYENMVSGGGLEYHYKQIVNGRKPSLSAGEIAQLARNGDADAMEALKVFNLYLMRIGSESSMAFVPSTIVIVGDNIVYDGFFYDNAENVKEMRREALNHAMERFGFQSRVTYLRQKKLLNFNLVGCYRCGLPMAMNANKAKSRL